MNHHGYIYQSTNFLYTGCTKQRTDLITADGKHARHYKNGEWNDMFRKVRSAKHRYVYFAMDRRNKRDALNAFKYDVLPYPKGDNSNYILGNDMKDTIIVGKTGQHRGEWLDDLLKIG